MSSSEKKPRSKKKPVSEKQLAGNHPNSARSTGLSAAQVRPAPHRTPRNLASPLPTSPSSGSKTSTKWPYAIRAWPVLSLPQRVP